MSVEVKIGIENTARELSLSTTEKADKVYKSVADALATGEGVLELTDEKGSRVLVPASKISYVEVGSSESRRVGFGAS
ncbi:DUF3107 domain-containing protein [Gordonia alkaliphila]|uniref:DUF3107 domain-containing protein n=1 Tax=Gordonia alkaliphila TaxID=1053547 RepID=A0ABP8ZH09_9ACTN|nr:DUF3107 domain-containing protein [Gordonia alkaliphila]MCK0438278.1 DUF3107 domain-containing protein [Gordonia alkaliphila]